MRRVVVGDKAERIRRCRNDRDGGVRRCRETAHGGHALDVEAERVERDLTGGTSVRDHEDAPPARRLRLGHDAGEGAAHAAHEVTSALTSTPTRVLAGRHCIPFRPETFRDLGTGPKTGIVQLGSPGFAVAAKGFAEAARRFQLPTIAFLKNYARSGVLMTYGPVQEIYFRRAVILADKILRGTPAGELPIEGPDRFELTINLRTSQAIGLEIPSTLVVLADEVIE